MADRIPTFQAKVGVNDAPGFNVSLPGVVDAGQEISSVGRSLLQASEPLVRAQTIKFAEDEAAQLKLSKSPDGTYSRAPDPRTGSGLVYREAFDKIVQQREVSLYDQDHQERLNQIQSDHRLDPQGFLAAATEFGKGQLEKISPDVRGAVEVNYTRELVQRMNQVRSDTEQANLHQAIDAAQSNIAYIDDRNKKLASEVPSADTIKILESSIPEMRAQLEVLKGAGYINDEGIKARMLQTALNTKIAIERSNGFIEVAQLGIDVKKASDAELVMLADTYQGSGATHKIDIFGKTGLQRQQDLPVSMWTDAGQVVNDEISRRQREQALRMQQEAIDAQVTTAEALQQQVDHLNADPAGNRTAAQVATDEAQLAAHGSITDQMYERDANGNMVGQDRLLSYFQTKGSPPKALKGWIEQNTVGAQLPLVANFVAKAAQARNANGVRSGINFYRDLSPETRASLEAYYSLRRVGIPESTVIQQVEQAAQHQTVSVNDLPEIYRTRRQTYEDIKHDAIQKSFGLKTPGDAHALTMLEHDFDNQLAFFKSTGMPSEQAMQTAVDAMGRFYMKHEIFLLGVGPKEAMPAGIAPSDYDKSIVPAIPVSVRGSATFSNHRLKLQPIEYNPDSGFLGRWNVVVVNSDGQAQKTFQVDMQKHMPQVILSKMVAEKKAEQARVQQAIKDHTQKKAATEAQTSFQTVPQGGF